ncbi:chromatin binding protein [Allomyces javanicus]|nr:chromatin binding protein [Allomyces javanicus]
MNIPLIESWLDAYPTQIDFSIPDTNVVALAFNRRGNHLAGAAANGAVIVWDVDMWSVLRLLHGHAASVTSLSWSRSGRYLASGGQDWRCIVWDMSTGEAVHTFDFDVPVTNVSIHPFKSHLLVASLQSSPPVLIDTQTRTTTPLPAAIPLEFRDQARDVDVLACWDATGHYIFTGTSKGHWHVLPLADPTTPVFTDRLAAHAIRHFAFARSGSHLAATVNDKTIRTYHLPYVAGYLADRARVAAQVARGEGGEEVPVPPFECVPMLKLQDLVNRNSWCSSAWAGNEEFVIGATAGRMHELNVWNVATGTLVKLLEGPSEPLLAFAWHPVLPVCVSLSQKGTMYVWNTKPRDRWSAFAPDFKEIEDNVEYEEREDEFDLVEEPTLPTVNGGAVSAAAKVTKPAFVDLVTPIEGYTKVDEDDDGDEPWSLTVSLDHPVGGAPHSAMGVFAATQPPAALVSVQRDDPPARGKRRRED